MGSGYRAPKDGVDALRVEVRDLRSQLDAIRSSLGLSSAVLTSGKIRLAGTASVETEQDDGRATRLTGGGVEVRENPDGDWRPIEDVVIEMVPEVELSDGIPPVEAPTNFAVRPFSVGAVEASWLAPANADPILGYDLQASAPEPDEAAETFRAGSTRIPVSSIGGELLTPGETVHLRVRAVDLDGPGPWTAWASAEPRLVDFELVSQQIRDDIAEADNKAVAAQEEAAAAAAAALDAANAAASKATPADVEAARDSAIEAAASDATTKADAARDAGEAAASAALNVAEAKGRVIVQSAAPDAADQLSQNLWIDTTAIGNPSAPGNVPKRWDGTGWVAITEKAVVDAAAVAAAAKSAADTAASQATTALSTANGKNKNTRSSVASPATTGRVEGDLHYVVGTGQKAGQVTKIQRLVTGVWVDEPINVETLAGLDVGYLTAMLASVDTLLARIVNAEEITGDMISSLYAYIGTIEANQIAGGKITADIAWVGGALTIGDELGAHITADPLVGMVLYGLDGVTPLVELRLDGQPSTFRGRVIADDISVLNGALLQGAANTVALNAVLTLEDSIPNPQVAPTMSTGTIARPFATPPSGYTERGVTWDATIGHWLQTIISSSTKTIIVRRINPADGSVAGSVQLARPGVVRAVLDCSNTIRVGSSYYTLVLDDYYDWYLFEHNLSGGHLTRSEYKRWGWRSGERPSLGPGTSATRVVVADTTWPQLEELDVSSAFPTTTGTVFLDDPQGWDSRTTRFAGRGTFHFGVNRWVVATSTEVRVYVGTTPDAPPERIIDTGTSTGVAWDGTRFYSSLGNGTLRQHSRWLGALNSSNRRWWARITNAVTTPSTKQTAASPAGSILVPDGHYLSWNAPQKASQTSHYGVYLGSGASEPAVSAMRMFGSLTTSPTGRTEALPTSGATPPTASQFTASGNPGEVRTQSGGGLIRGNGYARLEGLVTAFTSRRQSSPPAQTNISHNTVTKITSWDDLVDASTRHYEPTSADDIAYASGDFTVKIGGLYEVAASVALSANANGVRRLYVQLNGVTVPGGLVGTVGNTSSIFMSLTVPVRCAPGDVLSIGALHTAGSGTTLQVANASGVAITRKAAA
ncbi:MULTISPECIES: fibronectin type III domain-containing protein [unclassified Aeromicrobium]|uniref:fibronectin type III domain-containing protein n=1 Tax=unclassified Aeromicrobium TaxID=2633570 RepID=UPI00288A9060|nr:MULTISPECIES: fibronectin type III domain-containing protein [unclassified Aeromicrobium]